MWREPTLPAMDFIRRFLQHAASILGTLLTDHSGEEDTSNKNLDKADKLL